MLSDICGRYRHREKVYRNKKVLYEDLIKVEFDENREVRQRVNNRMKMKESKSRGERFITDSQSEVPETELNIGVPKDRTLMKNFKYLSLTRDSHLGSWY